jgi:anti-sigma factor RsiW
VSILDNDELRLQAYCDDELDPASVIEFERRLAADASLMARYDNIIALRSALRSLPRHQLPAALHAGVHAALSSARRQAEVVHREAGHPVRRSWSWRALAASAVIGAVFGGSVMSTMERADLQQDVSRQIAAGHIRSLLAPQPFDIASSDRHTVKPWFTARLPESPQVVDLAAQGFRLAGGRVDVIGTVPVATLVYQHAAHIISLISLRSEDSVPDGVVAGYNMRSWSDGEFTYVAVSDLPMEKLASFERAFTDATRQNRMPPADSPVRKSSPGAE